MLWQAQTDMYFRMAGGWIGPLPDEYQLWPIVNALGGAAYVPDVRTQLMCFLSSHDVDAIVVSDNDPDRASWRSLLAPLAVPPVEIGGVTLYRIPPETLARYGGRSAVEAQTRADTTLFNALLAAAWKYAAEGKDPSKLTPLRAKNLNLLPADWLTGPSSVPGWLAGTEFDPTPSLETRLAYGVFLGRAGKTYCGVGVMGTYDALKPVIDDYRRDAYKIFFPAPRVLTPEAKNEGRGFLLMVFETDGLARAETKAAASLSGMPRQSRIPEAARPGGGARHTVDAARRSR
jgi:hypothetical protein